MSGKINVLSKVWFKGKGIYIGRPTLLGNPYASKKSKLKSVIPVATNAEAVKLYDELIDKTLEEKTGKLYEVLLSLAKRYSEGETINLICWCVKSANSPNPCHGYSIKRAIERIASNENS